MEDADPELDPDSLTSLTVVVSWLGMKGMFTAAAVAVAAAAEVAAAAGGKIGTS